jgi:hypothetical protein
MTAKRTRKRLNTLVPRHSPPEWMADPRQRLRRLPALQALEDIRAIRPAEHRRALARRG